MIYFNWWFEADAYFRRRRALFLFAEQITDIGNEMSI